MCDLLKSQPMSSHPIFLLFFFPIQQGLLLVQCMSHSTNFQMELVVRASLAALASSAARHATSAHDSATFLVSFSLFTKGGQDCPLERGSVGEERVSASALNRPRRPPNPGQSSPTEEKPQYDIGEQSGVPPSPCAVGRETGSAEKTPDKLLVYFGLVQKRPCYLTSPSS